MGHRNDQKNRRPDIFHESRVKEVLSSHIRENYPKLVSFLDVYYNFMDSDGGIHGFDNKIHEILSLRDTEEVPEEFLAQLTYELASRLENNEKFTNARFALQRLAYLYREKGTPKGIEEFFKTFFQTEVEVIYPKKDIFIVGEDEIGPDYEHYIQDYRLYQNYSLLLKLGLSRNQYETLYKKFMHPAGWYFEGETSFTSEALMPIGVSFPLEDSAIVSYINEVYEPIFQQSRYTEIVSQNTNNEFYFSEIGGTIKTSDWKRDGNINYEDSHLDMLYNTIADYQNYTIEELGRFYEIGDFAGSNSHTFDEDSIADPVMDFSNAIETMDNGMFTRYDPWFHHRDSSA